ncbi:MAG TPA: hypothetical protein VM754_06005 [Actinomycetota bacterium]|nr:hypothetical protein [Actinomycetota bacterium]
MNDPVSAIPKPWINQMTPTIIATVLKVLGKMAPLLPWSTSSRFALPA